MQLTINVQRYERVPFSDHDSGIKVSCSFAIFYDICNIIYQRIAMPRAILLRRILITLQMQAGRIARSIVLGSKHVGLC